MFRVQQLIDTPLVEMHRTEHLPEAFETGTVEENESSHSLCFIESGGFQLGAGKNEWLLGEGDLYVSRPGAKYRYTHLSNVPPDVCFVVQLSRELPFEQIVAQRTNRVAFLRYRLESIVEANDALAAECWTADMLHALANPGDDKERPYRSRQLRWYADRVEAARAAMTNDFSEPHSLTTLATDAGMSPFQFARIFKQLVGVPPHQFLVEVRLTEARQLLLDGVSVTDACYDTGFSSLSHFIRMFARRFGCTPSKAHKVRDLHEQLPMVVAQVGDR